MEIHLLSAIKVTKVQIICYEHACLMPCVPCGFWSLFIGTFRGSDVARSASQNRTTSTVVTTIVEKERFFQSYYNRNARKHFKLSVLPLTYPQGLFQVPDYVYVLTCALLTFQTIWHLWPSSVTAACPYPALRLDKLYAALIRCLVLWTVTKHFLVSCFKGLYL